MDMGMHEYLTNITCIFTSYSDEIFKSEIGDNRKSVLNQSRYKSRQDAEFETKNK